MTTAPCDTCTAYRRGERDNVLAYGVVVHACERKADGSWAFDACPCGCAAREVGIIARDKAIFGTAFLGPRGERIDPTTVTASDDQQGSATGGSR